MQSVRCMIEQERLARKQTELEPWKIVLAALAVGAAFGGLAVRAIYG